MNQVTSDAIYIYIYVYVYIEIYPSRGVIYTYVYLFGIGK